MIYDEGFEVSLGNTKFFFFNKYYKKGSEFLTDCSRTLIGWVYSDVNGTPLRGCAYGQKEG